MRRLTTALCAVAAAVALSGPVAAASQDELIEEGRAVYHDKTRGNCISCHNINDPIANLPGSQGPMMIAMQQRFPDKRKLRAQIWDATVANPLSIMPPIGKHWILSEDEIDAVVEYIYQY
ncbi:MAG: sulfur oxidation c-type cytochrome SoxX [Oceanospirillales bacterium]|uniref:Monoheme cytochrome SoxX (Sulfur oxidation) n=1 Tax=Marinobacterium halophilum TaxID=267374 RepID=A0A2P8EUP9_9GAMM|nr:sulfur oxidation c-type cytochrome SoxX [Marinobacterium halophilum]MBR9827292.1 sulfur oxidation c-type cytochrome SoxX [Oceanospirillales bacterium]PSL13197.1 monoheme cytochrome SoxX (sulfur oxidation) [Marinobacterium halophilum]